MGRHRFEDHTLKQLRRRKYRLRGGQSVKFIPAGDSDFAHMARVFANGVAKHAARFAVGADRVEKLNSAVEAYRTALVATMGTTTAGPHATRVKNTARRECEAVVRAVARIVRVCADLNDADRLNLNMTARPEAGRMKARSCPQVAPVLTFIGNADDARARGAGGGMHVLRFGNDFDRASNAKPKGAARLEVFVDLVPPHRPPQVTGDMPRHIASYDSTVGGQVPVHPMQTSGRLWYVGSFTTNKFAVEFPVMRDGTPMLVCYWARWADAKGGVGPFSQTCVARVEGGTPLSLVEPMWIGTAGPEMAPANGGTRFIEPKQLAGGATTGMVGTDTIRIEGRGSRLLPA